LKKAGNQNGIESVQKHAGNDINYEYKTFRKGEPYFVLKVINKQISGSSEMYPSTSAMKKAIASVEANAPEVTLVGLKE